MTRIEGKISRVERNPDNGFIESLLLDSGHRVAGEFFIDCTGFRAWAAMKTWRNCPASGARKASA